MKNNNMLIIDGHLNYEVLLSRNPWLIKEKQKAIISPDVDGILSGLFMSNYLNWEVVGYYDGKNLAIRNNIKVDECIFLDVEIYRSNIKSCGHHIVLHNKRNIPSSWNNFTNCINPNILRNFDAYNDFQEKYPLATIHFLLCAISSLKSIKITLPESSVSPLIYVDGTFKNLLNYPENCISWLKFLNAKDQTSPIYPIFILFANRKISTIMHDLENIFEKFKKINEGKKGGDKIKIADISDDSFTEASLVKINQLLNLLSDLTNWRYDSNKWNWKGLKVLNFSKMVGKNLTNKKYSQIISKKPLSFAITRSQGKEMEYTLEKPDSLF